MPFSLGGPAVIVAVEDDAYDALVQAVHEALGGFVAPVIVQRASEFDDPRTEADFWLGHYEPTGDDRQLLFVTEAFETYEQDPSGLVYINGEIAWPAPPVAFGNPRTGEEGNLRQYHEGALLFAAESVDPDEIAIQPFGRVIQLARLPTVTGGPVPPKWLDAARASMEPLGPDLAKKIRESSGLN